MIDNDQVVEPQGGGEARGLSGAMRKRPLVKQHFSFAL
jgi:hypothetical protein